MKLILCPLGPFLLARSQKIIKTPQFKIKLMLFSFSLDDINHYDHKVEQIVGYTLAAFTVVGVVAIIIRCHWLHRRKYACR